MLNKYNSRNRPQLTGAILRSHTSLTNTNQTITLDDRFKTLRFNYTDAQSKLCQAS